MRSTGTKTTSSHVMFIAPLPLTKALTSSFCYRPSLNKCHPSTELLTPRRRPRRPVLTAVSTSPSPNDDSSSSDTSSSAQSLLRALEFDEKALDTLRNIEDEPETEAGKNLVENQGAIQFLFTYAISGLDEDVNDFFSSPYRLLPTAAATILFGFFAATSATTIIGSVADWDPLAAAVLLILTEGYTKFYYAQDRSSRLLQLINAFKIGLIYGMTVDSFKLCT